MKPFDPTKPCKTRDGKEVKIYAIYTQTDDVHGAYKAEDLWRMACWKIDGTFLGEIDHPYALINTPIKHKRKVWINLYPQVAARSGFSMICKSREDADYYCANSFGYGARIACIEREIEFEEGEGL